LYGVSENRQSKVNGYGGRPEMAQHLSEMSHGNWNNFEVTSDTTPSLFSLEHLSLQQSSELKYIQHSKSFENGQF
jgi:hypothetical protein